MFIPARKTSLIIVITSSVEGASSRGVRKAGRTEGGPEMWSEFGGRLGKIPGLAGAAPAGRIRNPAPGRRGGSSRGY